MRKYFILSGSGNVCTRSLILKKSQQREVLLHRGDHEHFEETAHFLPVRYKVLMEECRKQD